jgi:hypothetical protein
MSIYHLPMQAHGEHSEMTWGTFYSRISIETRITTSSTCMVCLLLSKKQKYTATVFEPPCLRIPQIFMSSANPRRRHAFVPPRVTSPESWRCLRAAVLCSAPLGFMEFARVPMASSWRRSPSTTCASSWEPTAPRKRTLAPSM